ncbi:MAG TPA: L-threonylcarbamoyladenylate synthase [Thermoanaerobaculia bacterium]
MKPDIDALAAVLLRDGVVLLPTDTIYGLHCLATSEHAVERIAAMKERDADKPFVVLASSIDQITTIGARIEESTAVLLKKLWPGPLTAVINLDEPIAASRGARTIAVRIPDLEWLRDLVSRTGPLASTSVNRSGEPPIQSPRELSSDLQRRIDALFDAGPLEGKPSTIVDFTKNEPRLIREGEPRFTQKVWKTLRKSL